MFSQLSSAKIRKIDAMQNLFFVQDAKYEKLHQPFSIPPKKTRPGIPHMCSMLFVARL